MRVDLAVVTAPEEEPVTLVEAKAHLRVSDDAEDDLIESLIVAAREQCELEARRAFVTQTLRLSIAAWPARGYVELMRPPLASVSEITYIDEDGDEHTMPTGDYVVDTHMTPGRVWLAPGASWPSEALQPGNSIRIEYDAGYGLATAVPQRYKQAILLLVGHWYENREQVTLGSGSAIQLPFAVKSLLMTDRGRWQ